MAKRELNWMIGGPQGSGIDTSANIFGRACGYGGYHLYGKREYHSNIKGLHSYFHFRVSETPVAANIDDVNLLAAFDAETIVRHIGEVTPMGGVIVDKEDLDINVSKISTLPREFLEEFNRRRKSTGEDTVNDLLEEAEKENIHVYPIPFLDLLKNLADKLTIEKLSKVTRMKNVLAIGVTFCLLGYDASLAEKAITTVFGEKPKIAEMNVLAFKEAYKYTKQNFNEEFTHRLDRLETHERRIFLSGFQAVALGKVLGGCRVQTYYPITPAADESEYLEAHEIFEGKNGDSAIVVTQTEDEIAAVNMASGAALAGARAATATSGPGFSLMTEGLSWAGNNEVPIVITYYQRGAPSTGLPTRHGQDDLRFAVHAGHGEFPRIVLASGDIEECFFDAAKAFNYAERYQVPVIHLVDKALANSTQSYKVFDLNQVEIDRGKIVSGWNVQGGGYKRFQFTESGVSPRAFLGTRGVVMWHTGDEHNEFGHISEEPLNRNMMMEKRMRKLDLAHKEIPPEEKFNFFGRENADTVVVSWGSPKGAILEAREMLAKEGVEIAFLQVHVIHPFPKEVIAENLRKAKKKIAVE
ncbi:MAG: 2-oxoacid:acceptor oxidoreductase subunit alpha, partial [Candidatus Bathyarchaeota archaeon]|nr:2-oxoacid:acceptor oxidoreductase subunit alpha [Candidatus Bathyarchaeota archaeon]